VYLTSPSIILFSESAACKLGRKKDLVNSLVTWCGTEDHPGVQGEANRLLAWLIKNSRYFRWLYARFKETNNFMMQLHVFVVFVLFKLICNLYDSISGFCLYDSFPYICSSCQDII
jgi:hypothetical protein